MRTLTLPRRLRFRPTAWRGFTALAGGILGGLAYPNFNLWPLIFVGFALIFVSIHGVGFFKAFGLGLISGMCFYLTGIYWISQYLGPEPLIALSLLESLIFAFGLGVLSLVWSKLRHETARQKLIIVLAIATIEGAREWVSTHFPYGGFPWMRVSQALADSWLNRWVFLGGLAGLTFLGFLAAAMLAVSFVYRKALNRNLVITLTATFLAVTLLPLTITPPNSSEAGSLRVAGIQGNAKAGIFANQAWGSILKNHIDQTRLLFSGKRAKSVDLVIWPENAADISPLDFPQAAEQINSLVTQTNKPLLFGTTRNQGSRVYNSSVLWLPDHGVSAVYDKQRPVPFAEYVPDRPFWYSLAPSLIGLIERGFSAGTNSGVISLEDKRLGVLICFEIAIDEINRNLVDSGAQVIISQTNNADFGHSAETYQQASLARLQAIATGRAVVNISTVGVSAIFMPNGEIRNQLPVFKAASLVATVPLRTSKTPAMWLGVYPEILVNLLAILFCLLALLKTRIRKKP